MSEPIADPLGTPEPSTPVEPVGHWSGLIGEDAGYVDNKGWKNPGDVISEYRDFEKYKGVPKERLIELPDPRADNPSEMGDVWNRLGRPEEASGYVFEAPEGVQINEDLVDSFRAFAHEKGLTASQATDAFNWNIEQQSAIQTAQDEAAKLKFDSDVVELKNEWGSKYDERLDLADRAAAALGLDDAVFEAMSKEAGPKVITQMFAKIADLMQEDKLSEGSGRTGYGQTIEQLVSAKDELMAAITGDLVRLNAYTSGKGADKLKMDQLYNQISQQEGLTQKAP